MVNDVRKLIDSILQLSKEERIELGKKALSEFKEGLKGANVPKEKFNGVILAFTKYFVSIDRKCSLGEYEMFTAITGMNLSKERFYRETNGGADPDFRETCFYFACVLEENEKEALVTFGVIIVTSDGNITEEEYTELEKLLPCLSINI